MSDAATLEPTAPRARPASPRTAPWGHHPIGWTLVIVYLLGLYTFAPLNLLPGPPIPGFIAAVAGWLLLFKNADRLRWSALWPLLAFFAVVTLDALIAPAAVRYFPERAKSLVYLAYSMGGALGLYVELARWQRREIAPVFFWAIVAILVGCFLEVYAGLGVVSDAFRSAVFQQSRSDWAEFERDLILFGIARPKLFTAEPSDVGKFLMLAMTMWIALSERRRYGLYALFALAGVFLVRSPILLLAVGTGGAVWFFLEPGGARRFFLQISGRRFAALVTLVAAAVIGIAVSIQTIFSSRIEKVLAGSDVSVLRRVFSPVYVAVETVSRHPVQGIGVGGEPAVLDLYIAAYDRMGMQYLSVAGTYTTKLFNFVWQHWIYLGLGFGSIALVFLVLAARGLGARAGAFVVVGLLIFSLSMGGYIGVRVWSYTMLLLLAGYHAAPAATAR